MTHLEHVPNSFKPREAQDFIKSWQFFRALLQAPHYYIAAVCVSHDGTEFEKEIEISKQKWSIKSATFLSFNQPGIVGTCPVTIFLTFTKGTAPQTNPDPLMVPGTPKYDPLSTHSGGQWDRAPALEKERRNRHHHESYSARSICPHPMSILSWPAQLV